MKPMVLILMMVLMLMPALAVGADEANEASEAGASADTAEASQESGDSGVSGESGDSGGGDALDQTMRELRDLRPADPVEPVRPQVEYVPSRVGAPSVTVDIDRSVLGVAPGQPQPTLRREGEFIVNRRGRLIRSPDGAHVLFAFEADSAEVQETPMVLQACRNLQAMEDYVTERGDTAVFIVSGQVHVYRGANYLLPTTWKLAHDQGNLQP